MTRLTTRSASPQHIWQLEQQGLHPLLARLYAARGVQDATDLDYALERLLLPVSLTHASEAAALLAEEGYEAVNQQGEFEIGMA
ncbi:MAG: hypothetical protein BWY57_01163 [Betaproteobacteria bacterium ADurb.Bin341]|nr:MAG: hypothetical protein BWY57_01163 [Betaproteobacteria bacterium ADurb.Bin341]